MILEVLGSQLGPQIKQVGSKLAQVGIKLAQVGPKLPHVGPSCSSWPKLAPSWLQDEPKLAPRWPQVGPCWLMLASNWLQNGPSPKVSPRPAKASTKALPLRSGFSQMSTKGLPQALRRLIVRSDCSSSCCSASKAWAFQDVHEGSASGVATFDCSLGLFHPPVLDLEGCFFLMLLSACPVMAGLSKRFIQTFLSSGSCRQVLLEVSSFFRALHEGALVCT